MKNWNLFAIMLLVALFAVSCGDEDPSTNIGGTCTTDGALMCEGDAILQCTTGNWAEIWDCAANGQGTCVQNGDVAACSGTGTDNQNPTDDNNTPTDTDTPVTGNCGNNTTDTGEVCDGDAKNCVDISASYTGGVAMCKSDCTGYDVTTCQSAADTDTATPDTDNVTPTGKTCMEINQCMGDCADATCQQACYDAGTTEGKAQFDTLMTCVQNNCATECGETGTNESCNACAGEKCGDEMDACFTVDVEAYGTVNANNTTFNYIYDGDGDLNSQIQSNQSGLLMNAVFTGTYGASNKPIPGAGASQTIALAIHQAASGGNPAILAVMQQSSNGQSIVNPIPQLMFPTDAITPGQFDMDPTKEGSATFVLLNAVGTSDSCLLAYCFSGTTNVTAATNTTAASGGSIALGVTNAKVYYPTETPAGDISGSFTGITMCAKE